MTERENLLRTIIFEKPAHIPMTFHINGSCRHHYRQDELKDRQNITRRGTPEQVDALIRAEVVKLGSREGGLKMIFGLYPGIPLENIRALMDAMERYAGYYR